MSAPIDISPDWGQLFEIMYDTGGVTLGVVLIQRQEKTIHCIYYADKSLNVSQNKHKVTKQDLITMVFAFEKLRSYLLHTKVIVYTTIIP